MKDIEYKKINYILSLKDSYFCDMVFNNVTKLFLNELLDKYNKIIVILIDNNTLSLERKKMILKNFFNDVPNDLIILRSHLKNSLYAYTNYQFNYFLRKFVREDFKRISFILNNL